MHIGGNIAPTPVDVQEFIRPSTVTNTQWLTWRRPRGAKMLHIFCVGGGGGGGGGFTGAAAAARGGGGGGGGSGQSSLLIPAHLLPDVLYVQVGAGGQGVGSGGGTAGSGVLSVVSIDPRAQVALNTVIRSGNAAGLGGGTGTGAAAGAAGTAGTILTLANAPLMQMGTYSLIAGQAGTAGGAQTGAAGAAQTLPVTGVQVMGGVGGGGVTAADQAGGSITAVTNTLISQARPINAAAGSNNGSGAFNLRGIGGLFFAYPGMGGGASNAGVGGLGGNGIHGSGGGGGGGGTTGGRGGDGGSGIVIITAW